MKFWKEALKVVDAHNEAPIIHASKRHLGIILTLAGYIFYAMYTVFFQIESFTYHSLSSSYTTFFELMVLHLVMLITFSIFCSAHGKHYFKCNKPKYIAIRSVLAVSVLLLYSLSRVWTKNVDNSMLYSTDAFWLVLMLVILHIPVPKGVWFGVTLGTAGIIFIFAYDYSSFHDIIGGIFGMLSGAILAIIIFITRYMIRRDPPLRIGFYNALFGFLSFLCLTIFFGFTDGWEMPTMSSMAVMIVSGLIWALALFFFLEAFYYAENYIIAAIALFLPIFVETFNWAINKDLFSWKTVVGTLFTGLGGVIIIITTYRHDIKHHHKKKQRQVKFPELINDDNDDDNDDDDDDEK